MKKCSYCGAEYPDDVAQCPIDHAALSDPSRKTAPPAKSHSVRPEYEFTPLSERDQQMDFVTLVRCGTLISADLVVSRLKAAGIEAFIPDEHLMQTIAFNLNTFGYVRVQVAPGDYDKARALLEGEVPGNSGEKTGQN